MYHRFICRICLSYDKKLHSILDTNLQEMYESLTLIPLVKNDLRALNACSECCRRLENCYQLRRQCLLSEKLHTQLRSSQVQVRCTRIIPDPDVGAELPEASQIISSEKMKLEVAAEYTSAPSTNADSGGECPQLSDGVGEVQIDADADITAAPPTNADSGGECPQQSDRAREVQVDADPDVVVTTALKKHKKRNKRRSAYKDGNSAPPTNADSGGEYPRLSDRAGQVQVDADPDAVITAASNASATNKMDRKKRNRRSSAYKDAPSTNADSGGECPQLSDRAGEVQVDADSDAVVTTALKKHKKRNKRRGAYKDSNSASNVSATNKIESKKRNKRRSAYKDRNSAHPTNADTDGQCPRLSDRAGELQEDADPDAVVTAAIELFESDSFFDELYASATINKKDSKKKRSSSAFKDHNYGKDAPPTYVDSGGECSRLSDRAGEVQVDTKADADVTAALDASATNKKDPKKRKRRNNAYKDGNSGNDGLPTHTPIAMTSPKSDGKSMPSRFYQDNNKEAKDNKEKSEATKESIENQDKAVTQSVVDKMGTAEPHTLTVNGLKGILCYYIPKGPKKSIKWKPDSELEEIQYLELDITERVNEASQKGRNLKNDDVMEVKTNWRPLILVDGGGQIVVEFGKNSKEKNSQVTDQKGSLQSPTTPDSGFNPDPRMHNSEHTTVLLKKVTGYQESIKDLRTISWPEPKGNAPPPTANVNVPAMIPAIIKKITKRFPNPHSPAVPPVFQPGDVVPPEWQNSVPPHIMPNDLPGSIPPVTIHQGAMPSGKMMSPENKMKSPEMFGRPNHMCPVPLDGFNMPQPMFPMDSNMPGPQRPPPGPEGFSGPGNFRGAIRERGASGHWRGKIANNWDRNRSPPRGIGEGGCGGGGRGDSGRGGGGL